jgi:hypothetical protein
MMDTWMVSKDCQKQSKRLFGFGPPILKSINHRRSNNIGRRILLMLFGVLGVLGVFGDFGVLGTLGIPSATELFRDASGSGVGGNAFMRESLELRKASGLFR